VGLRRQEIGVRLALGAQPRWVMVMVVGQGMRMALLGLAFGILGGLALGRAMSGLLYGVGSFDPGTLVVVAATLLGVAGLASLLPARQATAISAVQALRGA
jgi:putative ABC transport system permease protein